MKFTKGEFKSKYKAKKEVDELYNLGDEHSDRPNLQSVSQIGTDTLKSNIDDFSDYEEGIPTDLDKKKNNTMNNFMKHLAPFGHNHGNPYIREENGELEESAKEKMKRLVQELLSQRNNDNEIVNKGNDLDINNNNIVDIDELGDPDISVASNDLINAIKSSKLTKQQLDVVFNHIKSQINK